MTQSSSKVLSHNRPEGYGLVKIFDASRKVIVLKFQKPAQIKTLEEDELESCDFCLSDGLTRTTR